jgi:hypothetical protein
MKRQQEKTAVCNDDNKNQKFQSKIEILYFLLLFDFFSLGTTIDASWLVSFSILSCL